MFLFFWHCGVDLRSAFSFTLSVSGVRSDEFLSNETNWDASWNPIWFAKTHVGDKGWTNPLQAGFILHSDAPCHIEEPTQIPLQLLKLLVYKSFFCQIYNKIAAVKLCGCCL